MSYRVVIPRSIPFDDSNRVQQAVWKQGYSTRLAGRDATDHDRIVVEFLRLVPELPEPGDVGGLSSELDRVLGSKRVATTFAGQDAWLETVQRPPRKHLH